MAIHQPHDHLFKRVFGAPAEAASFLQARLPAALPLPALAHAQAAFRLLRHPGPPRHRFRPRRPSGGSARRPSGDDRRFPAGRRRLVDDQARYRDRRAGVPEAQAPTQRRGRGRRRRDLTIRPSEELGHPRRFTFRPRRPAAPRPAGTAVLDYEIREVSVGTAGSGYTAAPTVTLSGGRGLGGVDSVDSVDSVDRPLCGSVSYVCASFSDVPPPPRKISRLPSRHVT